MLKCLLNNISTIKSDEHLLVHDDINDRLGYLLESMIDWDLVPVTQKENVFQNINYLFARQTWKHRKENTNYHQKDASGN